MQYKSLQEIKSLRKKYNLNQKDLAMRSNVSQSLIAKIESGKVEPTFSKAQQIFQALEELREKKEIKVKDLMTKKVLFAQAEDSFKDIIAVMKKKGISQLPVFLGEKVIGIVTESVILEKISENPVGISLLKAEEMMEEVPPIVSLNTGFRTLTELLKENSLVLVAEKGEIKGLISKSDLLEKIE